MSALRDTEYARACRAHQRGELTVSLMPGTSTWAQDRGWETRPFRFKKDFLRCAVASAENWRAAVLSSGADFYAPSE